MKIELTGSTPNTQSFQTPFSPQLLEWANFQCPPRESQPTVAYLSYWWQPESLEKIQKRQLPQDSEKQRTQRTGRQVKIWGKSGTVAVSSLACLLGFSPNQGTGQHVQGTAPKETHLSGQKIRKGVLFELKRQENAFPSLLSFSHCFNPSKKLKLWRNPIY